MTAQPAGIVAAGRTDTGVHATGQVIAFDVEWKHDDDELLRAINSQLPLDIALQELWRQDDFHPRYDALWRQYAYRIATPAARHPLLNRHVWQLIGESLDLERMNAAATICLGEQDFAAFGTPPQAGSANTVRQVYLSGWELESELIWHDISLPNSRDRVFVPYGAPTGRHDGAGRQEQDKSRANSRRSCEVVTLVGRKCWRRRMG